MSTPEQSLWVLWRKPSRPIPAHAAVLSFLPPAEEEEIAGELYRAREVALEIKPDARRIYLQLVARLGITDCGGKTFRQRIDWWYHPVSFRDCEYDPTFGVSDSKDKKSEPEV